jgi:hypothetical protein
MESRRLITPGLVYNSLLTFGFEIIRIFQLGLLTEFKNLTPPNAVKETGTPISQEESHGACSTMHYRLQQRHCKFRLFLKQ